MLKSGLWFFVMTTSKPSRPKVDIDSNFLVFLNTLEQLFPNDFIKSLDNATELRMFYEFPIISKL